MSRIPSIKFIAGLFLAVAVNAGACVPDFPNRLLENGDPAVLQAPTAIFQKEIGRVIPRNTNTFGGVWMSGANDLAIRKTIDLIDMQELQELIGKSGNTISADQIKSYQAIREAIYDYYVALSKWDGAPKSDPPRFTALPVPEGQGIPREFSQYLKGAVLWYQGQTNPAVKAWQALLNLPADQRQYRSTWAAFMLGKAMLKQGEQAQAIAWFQEVRSLAGCGFRDSLGLAASSLGWEARAELDRKNHGRAIELYLDQLALGDPTALNSLRFAAEAAWKLSPKDLTKLVRNVSARKVLVAYALSYNQYY